MLGFLLMGLPFVLNRRLIFQSGQRAHGDIHTTHHIDSKTIFLQQSSLRKGEYYYSGRQHRVQRGSIGTWGSECGCAFRNNLEVNHK